VRVFFGVKSVMTAATIARQLIAEEKVYRGVKRPEARAIIAREAGLAPGTLRNLECGRLKHLDRVLGPLNALVTRKLEQRIASLTHELELARAAQSLPKIDLDRAQAALREAAQALGK